MAKVKIDWNRDAFEEIRRLPTVDGMLAHEVDKIAAQCNQLVQGYASVVDDGASRSRGSVYTYSAEAIIDNAKNNTLLRAFGGSGGLLVYTTKSGKTRYATQAQIDNWTRNKKS